MNKSAEFFFDVGSPSSYLAWTQLPGICERAGAALVARPMLLGGVFQATGNASPRAVPAKGSYTFVDLSRFAKRYGVPLRMNPHFPINTLKLMRAACGAQAHELQRFQDFLAAVFNAIWVDAANLNDPAVAAQVLADAGFDAAQVFGWAGEADAKAVLRANTEEAVSRGVFGAPTMFVDSEMYFGQDRLDFVAQAVA